MEATWWTNPEQLDDEQAAVVALPKKGDHLVLGPPGSGKTNLLLLRATFLHKSNIRHIAVLTFGRVLREFLATGVSNYPFAAQKIQTYMRWGKSILGEYGGQFDEQADNSEGPNKFKRERQRLFDELSHLVASGDCDTKYDCILLDEAQDYSVEEIDLIRHFTHQIFAVGDSHQQIYQKNRVLNHLGAICTSTKRLTANYRSGLKICRVADGILDLVDKEEGLEASSNYDEAKFPSSVQVFDGLTINDQVATAIPEIVTQLRAYPTGFIGVLCPRRNELGEVWKLLSRGKLSEDVQLQQFEEGYEAFDTDRRVIVTTLHGAKGLEFRAAHLLGMNWIKNFATQTRLAYTGVTRAKTSLSIYHDGPLPGYLERGIAALDNRSLAPPALKDLFL